MQNSSFIGNFLSGLKKKLHILCTNSYATVGISKIKHKILKHLPPGKIRGHKMLNASFFYQNPQEFLHGIKEIFIEKIYKVSLPDNPYIIDCGANIGLSVLYFKNIFPDAEILAFEPDERNFSLLEKNIRSFNLSNIGLRKEAVWNEDTWINFTEEASMSSKIEMNGSGSKKVKASRLRDFLNRKVDFLKIDIEGAEYTVLCDIADKLKNVDNMFIEYHGNYDQQIELTKLFVILTENNFNYYIKEALSVYNHPFIQEKNNKIVYDIQLNIFCHKNKASAIIKNP
ncbi:MAG TPA: FkbM family methyltransferase [Chitinophagaceae bacterium]|jgi:FkbM family methyltransferase|nr:FkbM family methyltransferase [Chitinophagaceae bacterium]